MANKSTSSYKSVIIIGAGVSGLSAAKRLLNHGGFDVTVLEASDRIGGRIHSVAFGESTVELGAQWVHGEVGNRIFEIASANELLVIEDERKHKKFGASSLFVAQDGDFLNDGVTDKIANLMVLMHESFYDKETDTNNVDTDSNKDDLSSKCLGDVATQVFWKFNESTQFHEDDTISAQILDWIHRFQNSIDGADHWNTTSCVGQCEYEQCVGNPTISWKDPANYSSLFELILNSTDDSMTCNLDEIEQCNKYSTSNIPPWIKLGKEVIKIQYCLSESPVQIICKDGSDFNCDYVICTIPLGTLKDCYTTLFKPGLPYLKLKAIQHIGFGAVDKIFLEFDHRWWPESCDGFNLLWDNKNEQNWSPTATAKELNQIDKHTGLPVWTRSLLGFYVDPCQPNVLVTWITGEPARQMETLDLDELKKVLVAVLRKFPGHVFSVSEPVAIKRSEWYTNPYSRGSYSFRQMSSESNDAWAAHLADPVLRDDIPVLCFAGEATHPHFYSTVHGGFESGIREADRIIAHVKANDMTFSFRSLLS